MVAVRPRPLVWYCDGRISAKPATSAALRLSTRLKVIWPDQRKPLSMASSIGLPDNGVAWDDAGIALYAFTCTADARPPRASCRETRCGCKRLPAGVPQLAD